MAMMSARLGALDVAPNMVVIIVASPHLAARVGRRRSCYRAYMWIRLRQVAVVAHDLAQAMSDLTVSLRLGEPFHDPGVAEFGLANAVWPIGRTFLEVVSPTQPGASAGRHLARRHGDGGYMILLQCDDVDAMRLRFTERGVPIIWQCDLPDIRGTHFHPKFTGGPLLSIDETVEPDSWRWGGPRWAANVRMEELAAIIAVDIQAANPEALATHWADLLDKPAVQRGTSWVIALDEGELRFVPLADDRGDGISAIEVMPGDHSQHRLGGTISICGITVRYAAYE